MTRLTVNVELDEAGRPVFRLTPAQLAELGLQGSAAHEARWEVEGTTTVSPLRQWIGIAPKLDRQSGGGQPRRILADFLIGAHAAVKAGEVGKLIL